MKGFTMVELIAIMAIIGILAIVAIPKLGSLTDYSNSAHAAEVSADLAFARKTAIAARRYVCVDVSSNRVTFTMDPRDPDTVVAVSCASTSPVPLPGSDQTGILNPPSNVLVTSTASSFYFKPTGEASTDVTITAGGQSVSVSAITGAVS